MQAVRPNDVMLSWALVYLFHFVEIGHRVAGILFLFEIRTSVDNMTFALNVGTQRYTFCDNLSEITAAFIARCVYCTLRQACNKPMTKRWSELQITYLWIIDHFNYAQIIDHLGVWQRHYWRLNYTIPFLKLQVSGFQRVFLLGCITKSV